jgi:hypothetical protein
MSKLSKYYDRIYIGAGLVNCLDAANTTLEGLKVLIIDDSTKIGGAWKSISPFNEYSVENAVHYLVPHQNGYHFIEENLHVRLSPKAQYKYFATTVLGSKMLLDVRNPFNRALVLFLQDSFKKLAFNEKLFRMSDAFFKSNVAESRYPIAGSQALVEKVSSVVDTLNVSFSFSTMVSLISISDAKCKVSTNHGNFYADKIIIGHGFNPPNSIFVFGKKFRFLTEKHLRPSLHIQCDLDPEQSKRLEKVSQVLFPENHIIKYVHNLTRFSQSGHNCLTIVVALRHDCTNQRHIIDSVIAELREYGIFSNSTPAVRYKTHWQDIYLPLLSTNELKRFSSASHAKVKYLLTEDMSYALGVYSNSWKALVKWLSDGN